MQHVSNSRIDAAWFRRRATALAIGSMLAAAGPASAFEIPTADPDFVMRWDNTLRANLGVRAQSQDKALINSTNFDDGDRNFSNGSLVTSRLDVLSEFDLVWQRRYGVRFSAALWWDPAYGNLDNAFAPTANTLDQNGFPAPGQLSPFTKRYAEGPSGEWLDAFAFANFDLGDMPVNVKAGQHTVYWGESLLFGGAIHGISYAQNSLDAWKGFATPGAEAKELYRPRGGLTLQVQPMKELSLAGQWFYNWQAVRIPESGSYLTVNDALQFGADSFILSPNPFAAAFPGAPSYLRLWNVNNIPQSRTSGSLGDWGVSARWSPAWLDGTMGFYYRNATDIVPQLLATPGVQTGVPAATCTAIGGIVVTPTVCIINPKATTVADLTQKGKAGTYQFAYGDNIHIFGLSLSKEFGGVSVGAELSYRENMPLNSDPVNVLPAALVARVPGSIATTSVPSTGTPGALGNTMHGLVNVFNVFPKTPLFDTAQLFAELTWMQWLSVTQNEAVFKGRNGYVNANCACTVDQVTKNFWGLGVNFTPTWFQVLPGVDILAPMSWSGGLSGNSAVAFGGNEGGGNYSIGIAADVYQKYRFDLKYTGYYGNYATSPATGGVTVTNGANAAISDRGWISLTFKTTF